MRAMGRVLFSIMLLGLLAGPASGQSKAQASYDKLKTLVGEWEGTASNGKPANVSYKLMSGGSALVETLTAGGEETMVTIYHLDGDRLMVTHYCAAGNQPRMVGAPDSNNPNVITFKFLDATNLSSSEAGHMRSLVVTLVDKEHFTQQWSWREKDKDIIEVFHFTRKK